MFTEIALRSSIADTIACNLIGFAAPTPNPMPCDRWLARSLLHKAIRRGDVELAWRALASLLHDHPAGIWRALTIIAMEDVGVSGMEPLTAAVLAGRDRRWRERNGGDWKVSAFIVQQLCLAEHDQAVCDLFHHAVGNPAYGVGRSNAIEQDIEALAEQLHDRPLIERGIAALAIGGGLAEGQRHRDPFAVLEMLPDHQSSWPIIDICRGAWRLSRCPLALLLPLVWEEWIGRTASRVADDPFPRNSWVGDLPGYAIDQFTRTGIQVARRLLAHDAELRGMLNFAGIPKATQHRTVGDLIFLVEGSPLARRTIWPTGDELRMPYRCLADTVALGSLTTEAVDRVARQLPLIAELRQQLITPLQARLPL